MRTEKEEKKYKKFTAKEKIKRTSLEEFKKRKNVIIEWEKCFITKNEFPHNDRPKEQYVLWKKNPEDINMFWDDYDKIVKWADEKDLTLMRHKKH